MKKGKINIILLYLLLFAVIFSTLILNPLDDFDEIWNYNFARNIANGLVPYRDFNMIITPLLSFICGIFLKIIADELIIMRILAAVLCSAILFITYKIFDILKVRKELPIIFTFLIGYLFSDIFCIDYNYASLFMTLLIIYYELKIYMKDEKLVNNNIKQDMLLGILAGITITMKQTVGILISLVLLGNKLLFIKSKTSFKMYLKSFVYRLIGIAFPNILLIVYLLINNALSDFISYTVLGIKGFNNYVSYRNLIRLDLIGILSILVPITFIYEYIKNIILDKNIKIYIILVYGLAIFSICFPISDEIHFLIGAYPIIILMLYKLNEWINIYIPKEKIKNIIEDVLLVVIIFCVIYCTFTNAYNYIGQINNTSQLQHYKYIPISEEFEKEITTIDNYIITLNKNIKILDAAAAMYMIPINRYNKDYDMFNRGNLGKDGEERIIGEIVNSTNIQYLILKDEITHNGQALFEVINYIKKTKTKISEIEIFDIYE